LGEQRRKLQKVVLDVEKIVFHGVLQRHECTPP
jgi:hypothetical protein